MELWKVNEPIINEEHTGGIYSTFFGKLENLCKSHTHTHTLNQCSFTYTFEEQKFIFYKKNIRMQKYF